MRLRGKTKGAVTVFFVIILMACFLFGGFFIDASRILVAKRQVKNAVNSAARSTLSYYDENVVSEYGLFAFDGDNAEENFNKYLADNLTKSKDKGMNLFKYSIESVSVTAQKPLEGEELERQIVEYEKYRGPVNITLGVVDKFKKIFTKNGGDTAEQASKITNASDAITDFKDGFKDRGGILSSASKALKNTIKDNIKSGVKKNLSEVTTKWVTEGLPNDLDKQYKEAEKQIEDAELKLEELKKERDKYVDAATDICDGGSQEATSADASQYIDQNKTLKQQADEQIAELESSISTAKKILSEVKTEIENIRNPLVTVVKEWETKKAELEPAKAAYNSAKSNREEIEKNKKAAENEVNNFDSSISGAQNTISNKTKEKTKFETENSQTAQTLLSQYAYDVYSNADWKEFCRLTDKTSRTSDEEKRLNELKNTYKSGDDAMKLQYKMMDNYGKIAECNKAIANANATLNNASSNKSSAQARLNSLNSEYSSAVNDENEKKKKVDEIENKIKELEKDITNKQDAMAAAAEKLGSIPDMNVEGITVPKLKQKIKDIANEATEYSEILSSLKDMKDTLTQKMSAVTTGNDEKVVDEEETNVLTILSDISENVKSLVRVLTNAESLRNEMYYIDYVMDKNTFLTSQTSRSHYFNKAEVEYTIFGFDSQGANILAAVGSIYAIRLVIDSFDYFLTSVDPELLSRIGCAIGKGAARAAKDMVDMLLVYNGEEASGCSLCPSLDNLNLKLSYSDHLRLFLLMNSGTSKEGLKNAMSTTLVSEKHTKDLDELYTQVKADVSVKVNLLILPMIGSDLLPNKYFSDGCYVIHESVVEGYE